MNTATATAPAPVSAADYIPVNSGAAGAAKFAGSDSRKYNYFTPDRKSVV